MVGTGTVRLSGTRERVQRDIEMRDQAISRDNRLPYVTADKSPFEEMDEVIESQLSIGEMYDRNLENREEVYSPGYMMIYHAQMFKRAMDKLRR